jgi:hypothetical protein
MAPDTHAELLNFAKDDGYQHLGEWLDMIPADFLRPLPIVSRQKQLSPTQLNSSFRKYTAQGVGVVCRMLEFMPHFPHVLEDAENLKALKELQQKFIELVKRLGDFGVKM